MAVPAGPQLFICFVLQSEVPRWRSFVKNSQPDPGCGRHLNINCKGRDRCCTNAGSPGEEGNFELSKWHGLALSCWVKYNASVAKYDWSTRPSI